MSLGAYVPFTPWYKAFEIRKRIIVTTFSGDGSIQQVEEREGYARCQFREPLLLVESRMLADARYLCFEYCRLVAHIPTPVNEKERYRLLQTVPTGVVHDVTPGVIERFQRDLNSGDLSFGTDEGNESSRMLVNIVLLFGVNNQRVESVDFGEYVVVRDASGVIMKKESERWTADFKRGHSKKKQLWRLLSMW